MSARPSQFLTLDTDLPKTLRRLFLNRPKVKRDQIDTGAREGVTTSERQDLKALERENKELSKDNEIPNLASAFFTQAELELRLKSRRNSSISIGAQLCPPMSAGSD